MKNTLNIFKIKILLFGLVFISNNLYSQNRFQIEFALGVNVNSIKLDEINTLEYDQTHSIQSGIGINTILGAKYNISKRINLVSNLSFNKIKYTYNLIDDAFPDEKPKDFDEGEIVSKINGNNIAVSFGTEYIPIKNIGIAIFLSYNKLIDQNTKSHIVEHRFYSVKDENIEQWLKVTSYLSFSSEISYNFTKRVGCIMGIDYPIIKEKIFPVDYQGQRYRYYFLFSYMIK